MIVILVCLLQITLIAGFTSTAARFCLDRSPRLSARISLLGITLSAVVVVATCCDVPRLWTLQATTQAGGLPGRHFVHPNSVAPEAAESVPPTASEPAFEFTAQHFMHQLSQLRNRHPVAASRMAGGYLLLAALVCLLGLGRCVVGSRWVWSLRKARSISEESMAAVELKILSARHGVSFPLRLRASRLLSSPCVSWLSRGTIYVPDDFEQWTADERHAALAHELIHEVRRDSQTRFFAELCLSLLCCHPLMLLLRRQLIFAQELATDRQAAGLLGSLNAYQRGLSMLALRMDSHREASYLVSVSTNDVIRRIKMLSSTTPSMSRWQEIVSVAVVLFVSAVAAAWTANADDPIRAVSRQKIDVSESASQKQTMSILPWEQFGEQDGYAVVQPAVLAKHQLFKMLYEAHVAEALEGVDLNALGLAPENIKSLQVPLVAKITEIPEDERANHDGHRHSLTWGADAVVIETKQAAQWVELSEVIPPYLASAAQREALRQKLSAFEQQTFMCLVSEDAKNRSSQHAKALRSVWGEVSNCPLAIASATPSGFESGFNGRPDVLAARPLLTAVDSTAVGITFESGNGQPKVRFAFAPRNGHSAAEVLTLVENTKEKILTTGRALVALRPDSLSDDSKLEAMETLLNDVAAVTPDVAAAEDGSEIVVATMHLTVNLENLLP